MFSEISTEKENREMFQKAWQQVELAWAFPIMSFVNFFQINLMTNQEHLCNGSGMLRSG